MGDQSTLQIAKDIVDLIASVTTIVGIVVGGIFAWRRWGKEAPLAARGDLSHEVMYCPLSESHRLVHVAVTIKNTGTVTLTPIEAYTILQRVAPLEGDFSNSVLAGKDPVGITKVELDWPVIARRDYPVAEDDLRIDSGETEKLHADFIIPLEVRSFFAYSLACMDPDDDDLGWDVTSFHEIRNEVCAYSPSSNT